MGATSPRIDTSVSIVLQQTDVAMAIAALIIGAIPYPGTYSTSTAATEV